MLETMGIALRVDGTPIPGAALIVANHVSWLDIMVVHAVLPETRFVSKADVKGWPLVSRLVDSAGTLYLERERKRDAVRVIHVIAEALRAGQKVAIFPEARPRPATACCRSTPICCKPRSRPARRYSRSRCGFPMRRMRSAKRSSSSARRRSPEASGRRLAVRASLPASSSCRRAIRKARSGAGLPRCCVPTSARVWAFSRRKPDAPRRPRRRRRPAHRRGSSCGSASARRRARRPAECRSGC